MTRKKYTHEELNKALADWGETGEDPEYLIHILAEHNQLPDPEPSEPDHDHWSEE